MASERTAGDTTGDPDAAVARAGPTLRTGPRGSTLVALLFLALTVSGAAYLHVTSTVEVVVAAQNLSAYHEVLPVDIAVRTMPRNRVPAGAVENPDLLIGRYTQHAVRRDTAVTTSTLGPVLATGTLDQLTVTALDGTRAQILDGRLSAGDQVEVLLSGDSTGGSPVPVTDVLVLDVASHGDRSLVVLGLTPAQRTTWTNTDWTRWSTIRTGVYRRP